MLKLGVIGTHELLAPETLCCQALHRNNEMTAGQKLLESERMECRGVGLALTDGYDGSDGFDGDDGS